MFCFRMLCWIYQLKSVCGYCTAWYGHEDAQARLNIWTKMTLRSLSSSQMYCYYSSNFLSPFSPLNYSYMYVELLDVLLSQWLSSHLFSHCGSFYQFCTAVSSSLLVYFLPCIICFWFHSIFHFRLYLSFQEVPIWYFYVFWPFCLSS